MFIKKEKIGPEMHQWYTNEDLKTSLYGCVCLYENNTLKMLNY